MELLNHLFLLLSYVIVAKCCTPSYKCISNSIFEYKKVQYACVDNQICNWNNVDPCNPCIDMPFKCLSDPTLVNYKGEIFKCDDYYICNAKMIPPLYPCVPGSCPGKASFQCSTADPMVVKKDGFTFKCTSGEVCNKNFVAPCTMCVDTSKTKIDPWLLMKPLALA